MQTSALAVRLGLNLANVASQPLACRNVSISFALIAAVLAFTDARANASLRPMCCSRTDHSGTSIRSPSRVKDFR